MIPTICHSEKVKSMMTVKKKLVVSGGVEEGRIAREGRISGW